jgi:hypothetical protein
METRYRHLAPRAFTQVESLHSQQAETDNVDWPPLDRRERRV